MTHDRNPPEDSKRCKSCGASLLKSDRELRARNETSPLTIAEAPSSDEKLLSLREKALLIREESIEERESDLHRREELLALQQGRSFALRVQEISDAQMVKVKQEIRHSQLKAANEHLVIASIQSQILSEEIQKANVAIPHFDNHDVLTNLPNRLLLHDRITQAIALAKRHNEELGVLFLDLDHFKAVNDKLGHAIGDQLLQTVAQRIKSVIRSSDTVSRLGGDEFIIVLSEVNQEKTLALIVEKIHEIVTASYSIVGHDFFIGATIGISLFPQDGEDAETLIRNADDAMYYAKEKGCNKYQFFGQEICTYALGRQR